MRPHQKTQPVQLEQLYAEEHVWTATPEDITDKECLVQYGALLSSAEKERHQRFRFEKDRHTFLVSHALLTGLRPQ